MRKVKLQRLGLVINLVVVFLVSNNVFAQSIDDLMNAAEVYSTGYMNHLDSIGETKSERQRLAHEIQSQTKSVKDLNASLRATENELLKAKSDLNAIPLKIENHQREINRKSAQADRIFSDNFAGSYNSVEDAVDGIKSEERVLNRERQDLIQELSDVKGPYERRISSLESRIINNESRLSNDLVPKRKRLREDADKGKKELQELDRQIEQVQNLMNRPKKLRQRLKAARIEFKAADEARIKKGKSCGGLSPVFSGTCRRYIAAKDDLNNLERIKSGDRLRELKRSVKPKRRAQKRRRESLEKIKNEIAGLRQDIQVYQGDVQNLRRDLSSATLNIEIDIEEVDRRISRISSKISLVNKIQALREDVSFRTRLISNLRQEQQSLPGAISSLESSVIDLSQSLDLRRSALEASKNTQSVVLASLSKERADLKEDRSVLSHLIALLIQNGDL